MKLRRCQRSHGGRSVATRWRWVAGGGCVFGVWENVPLGGRLPAEPPWLAAAHQPGSPSSELAGRVRRSSALH